MKVKDVASNYISALVLSCTNADDSSVEYHDAKAALEDLDGIITAVHSMASEDVGMDTIVHYCTMYQREALETI